MSVQHTPGPWEHFDTGSGFAISCPGYRIATMPYKPGDQHGYEQNEANARLIAAAPDMLAALNTIAYEPIGHSEASVQEVYNAIVEIARAAVKKVTL